ncbi:RNA polymerase factor sigma-54 [Aliikangiella sp. G2MR2-5]|uniref:RNA polymerase factor sigma-54 n=1 Tax=Aliikangiella sp. G2MR2-5 TaxID=2788943 RepID=UPI0018ABD6EB|nr:RNA polymerase factor sigma-54 [Aliikangiella sp. G2MR2-5]
MKQSLQLKISQSLTMTPQLQQAIKLLQLSSLDLQSEIQQALDSNPLLDSEQGDDATFDGLGEQDSKRDAEDNSERTLLDASETETSDKINSDKIDSDLSIDTQWEDWGYTSTSSGNRNSEESSQFEYQGETSESLRDQLQFQIDMLRLSEVDRAIATILIDSIDERGYMNASIEDIVEMFREEKDDLLDTSEDIDIVEEDEVEAVLHLLQSFEPAGIAARDLQECLSLQLDRLEKQTVEVELAKAIVGQEFKNLSSRNYRQIMKSMGVNEEQLKRAVEVIQSLDPRPGNQLTQNTAEYVIPDVFVAKNSKGEWTVELNNSVAPKLTINENYAALIKRADNSPQNQYLKNNLQDAKWFIKSLQSRNETLLKVAACIVKKQEGFLEYGEEAMKPMVLNDVAEEVEMHESTISRVTTQKYMHTPRGIFELKYFFSSHVGTTAGGECSSTAIRAVIKKLIAAENQQKPLSDSKLANLLKEQGIKVARRTVAKYREAMSIPPSNERKKLI